ncbi:hypothetical protein U1839_13340 [Sphingomonas sp. RT2P30]|uniref:hypothetical protein n=1 Tax=Parasphingomonas halimpatiens TaxID=3096162 RepID=UPI002FC8B02C
MMAPADPHVMAPEWLAHRYDPDHDALHFVLADRASRRAAAFLTDEHLPGAVNPVVARRADIARTGTARRINFIFHSAYCCSTLLANAYDRPGRSTSFKEPVLLNDLVGWRHRGGDPGKIRDMLIDGLTLLARPFEPQEVCVVKPSNVVNGLAPVMMAGRPDAAALLLYAPLDAFLGSIANKGLWGRLWVRDLLAKFLKEGLVDLGFGPQEVFLQSDLQVAAVGWLAQHVLFAKLATAWPDRVRTLGSDALLADPAGALAAIDQLFGVDDTAAGRQKVVSSIFTRHAKFGGAFDAADRERNRQAATEVHGEELTMVSSWAATVAQQAGIGMMLPAPLISR